MEWRKKPFAMKRIVFGRLRSAMGLFDLDEEPGPVAPVASQRLCGGDDFAVRPDQDARLAKRQDRPLRALPTASSSNV